MQGLFESALQEEIYFKEAALEMQMLDHRASNLIDLYLCEEYLEDGENQSSEKKEGLLNGITQTIQKIIDAIKRMIDGFLDAIRMRDKDRLTAEKYMQSETAKVLIDTDIVAMSKAIDAEYLKGRKIVNKLSNITKIDPKIIADFVDGVQENLYENRFKIVATGKTAIKVGVAMKLSNAYVSRIDKMKGWTKETEKCMREMKNMSNSEDFGKLKKFSMGLNNLVTKTIHAYNVTTSTYTKFDERVKKEEKRMKKNAGK